MCTVGEGGGGGGGGDVGARWICQFATCHSPKLLEHRASLFEIP